jgi:hypothetical protein
VHPNQPPRLWQVPWLLARFLPHYLHHVVAQPYRGLAAGRNMRELLANPARRHQIAVYDAVLDLMLKGYAELAGTPLRPDTGRVAVMLTRVGFAFDDEYERRKRAEEPAEFADLLQSPQVQNRVLEWRGFMSDFGCYDSIRKFLMEFVAGLYADYARTAGDSGTTSFDTALKGATIDSGGLLVAMAHVVGQFQEVPASAEIVEQFSSVGVNGKLADDFIDFPLDLAEGRLNLLEILARDDEREHAAAVATVSAGRPMKTSWWRRHCPRAYSQMTQAYADHKARITSRWLRYVSDLMWTPALLGHARKLETRGRV